MYYSDIIRHTYITMPEKRKKKKKKKSRKKERKRKRSDSDSSSSSYSSGEEERRVKKKLLKKARKFLERASKTKTSRENLTEDDYFSKSREFRVWLRENRDVNFEDLSTEKAKKYFSKFIVHWNDDKLDKKFYAGKVEQIRTKHKWSFTNKINDVERMKLASVRDRVELQTHSEKKAVRLLEKKRERRRYNEHRRVVEEELVPVETGFQSRIAKRREKSERIHGASRHRDDGLSVPSRVLMGDDGSSLREAKYLQQRSNERRARKVQSHTTPHNLTQLLNITTTIQVDERNVRLMAAKAKEDAKMAAFMKEFGLNNPNAQRIKIQPRRN